MALPISCAAAWSSATFSLSTSSSSSSVTARAASSAACTRALASSSSFSPCSCRFFSVECTSESRSLRASIFSLRWASAAWLASASRIMDSMSASDSPPLDCTTMRCSLPVALSFADTLRMPSASMSNDTSIWGTPRGAGGMPTRSNSPSFLLCAATSRSPCRTLICTWDWLSAAVEKTWAFLVGMVVLRLIRRVKTPPRVSIPRERGVTSSRRMSFTSPRSTPAWIAAPMATTSSGFTLRVGFLPKKSSTTCCTLGMRVIPPTRRTSSTSSLPRPASCRHDLHGSSVRVTRSSTSASNLARVILRLRCFGPEASAVIKGRDTSVCARPSSSRLAFSAPSRRRPRAWGCAVRSMPDSLRHSVAR
mmetsp:Transcript_16093/g.54678  ORF Transcript_16093/g.54678 Transcript_16093/m.54678 type:complete len:364 (-) Transcript_16093:205-1296(-)